MDALLRAPRRGQRHPDVLVTLNQSVTSPRLVGDVEPVSDVSTSNRYVNRLMFDDEDSVTPVKRTGKFTWISKTPSNTKLNALLLTSTSRDTCLLNGRGWQPSDDDVTKQHMTSCDENDEFDKSLDSRVKRSESDYVLNQSEYGLRRPDVEPVRVRSSTSRC